MPPAVRDAYTAARDSRVDSEMSLSRGTFLAPMPVVLSALALQNATALPGLAADDDEWTAWMAEIQHRLQMWEDSLAEWVRSVEDGSEGTECS
jgi:hypothetical protein